MPDDLDVECECDLDCLWRKRAREYFTCDKAASAAETLAKRDAEIIAKLMAQRDDLLGLLEDLYLLRNIPRTAYVWNRVRDAIAKAKGTCDA